jgi:hypothetical protein
MGKKGDNDGQEVVKGREKEFSVVSAFTAWDQIRPRGVIFSRWRSGRLHRPVNALWSKA